MKLLNFKAHEEDIVRWKTLAHEEHISLAEWIRRRCNGDVFLAPPPPAEVERHVNALVERLNQRASEKASEAECTNRLPKGTFCKRCGKTH